MYVDYISKVRYVRSRSIFIYDYVVSCPNFVDWGETLGDDTVHTVEGGRCVPRSLQNDF